ncbi:hypothetical protein HDF24_04475 [Mucilaginibacter sp. X4EP1]|uniref:hypothetical protein n=1 Tax=Mucilaginibacter sp. X4EP1 TaxID=2723092 RepID=UPI0021684C18|nr:hypothetical protein [Mucilaginibacter sp. X4EP1]MCS3816245.1 hypothetical protein [Mucilaginibacter sp. X4EP1]
METTKGIEELREQLSEFEQDITESISAELERIGRPVKMDEFNYVPFNDEVQDYIEAIRLDEDKSPVLDTSFSDVEKKYFSSFISDNEIDHWNMIGLLEVLKQINQ